MKLFGLTFGQEEPKIENYLFLQRVLTNALDIIYSGFPTGEFFFVPPDPIIEGYYSYLHSKYLPLTRDEEVNAWLRRKNIQTTDMYSFRSLTSSFDFHIESWNLLKEDLLKEKSFLDRYVPHGAYVTKDIKLAAYEMEKWLEEHKKIKESVLYKRLNPVFTWRQFSIDTRNGKLTINYKNYDINPNNKEFQYLTYLIQNKNIIVRYRELASVLRINAYRENISEDKDVARAIQDIKKTLKKKLVELLVNKTDIRILLDAIESITNTGYRLKE